MAVKALQQIDNFLLISIYRFHVYQNLNGRPVTIPWTSTEVVAVYMAHANQHCDVIIASPGKYDFGERSVMRLMYSVYKTTSNIKCWCFCYTFDENRSGCRVYCGVVIVGTATVVPSVIHCDVIEYQGTRSGGVFCVDDLSILQPIIKRSKRNFLMLIEN